MWQFNILRTAGPTAKTAQEMVADSRRLFAQALRVGGYDYPVGATPVTGREWELHHGDAWGAFVRAKRRSDAAQILTPGQPVFAR